MVWKFIFYRIPILPFLLFSRWSSVLSNLVAITNGQTKHLVTPAITAVSSSLVAENQPTKKCFNASYLCSAPEPPLAFWKTPPTRWESESFCYSYQLSQWREGSISASWATIRTRFQLLSCELFVRPPKSEFTKLLRSDHPFVHVSQHSKAVSLYRSRAQSMLMQMHNVSLCIAYYHD